MILCFTLYRGALALKLEPGPAVKLLSSESALVLSHRSEPEPEARRSSPSLSSRPGPLTPSSLESLRSSTASSSNACAPASLTLGNVNQG
eukprot:599667-Rhodomonas_salina.1